MACSPSRPSPIRWPAPCSTTRRSRRTWTTWPKARRKTAAGRSTGRPGHQPPNWTGAASSPSTPSVSCAPTAACSSRASRTVRGEAQTGAWLSGCLYAGYYARHDVGNGAVVSVTYALLALLSEGPKFGLQLREEFEARTGEVWPLNVGQVYTTLQRLERDGLVESDDDGQDGPQKGFRITEAGATELTGWLRTPPDMSSPPRDELVMKVLVALRVPGTDA